MLFSGQQKGIQCKMLSQLFPTIHFCGTWPNVYRLRKIVRLNKNTIMLTKQCSINTNKEYLIAATVGQCCNTIDHFNIWQKTGLITHRTMTRRSSRLVARLFHLRYGSNATKCINSGTEHQQMCTTYRQSAISVKASETSKTVVQWRLYFSSISLYQLKEDGLANRCM